MGAEVGRELAESPADRQGEEWALKNRSFPGWVGPVVGPFVGLALGFRASREAGPVARVPILLGAAAMGLVAGLIAWFIDAREGD